MTRPKTTEYVIDMRESRTTEGEAPPPVVTPGELREIGLFGALPDAALAHLAEHLQVVDVEPGRILFQEGDVGDDMYVVLHGDIEVLKRSKGGKDSCVAVLGPRDWFGDMSILDVQPRSATVRALSPARLLRVAASDLERLYRYDIKAYALVVLNVAREMSRRLRVADGILADLIANVFDGYMKRGSQHSE